MTCVDKNKLLSMTVGLLLNSCNHSLNGAIMISVIAMLFITNWVGQTYIELRFGQISSLSVV